MSAFFLGLSSSVNAATYQFIDTSGRLQSVSANTPGEALGTAYQLGIRSGVKVVR